MKYLLVSIALLAVIMLASVVLLSPNLQPSNILFQEEPLEKMPLTLKAGEYYRYLYEGNMSGQTGNGTFTYWVVHGLNCTAIYVQESSNHTALCLDAYGSDRSGRNITFENPFIYFFKPWMLAVNEHWQWGATASLPLPSGNAELSTVHFETVGRENISGRSAYRVLATFSSRNGQEQVTYWVDEKKRILLQEQGTGYRLTLTDSNFS